MAKFGIPSYGRDPLAYADQRLSGVPTVDSPRSPTVDDTNYPIQTIWRNKTTLEECILKGFIGGEAQWFCFSQAAITFETDDGVEFVKPDVSGNVKVLSGAGITVTGNSPGNTITITNTGGGGSGVETLTSDSGVATEAAQNIDVVGGPGITTSASGDTLTINSVVYSDISGAIGAFSDNGYFCTAATVLTLPASPSQGEIVEVLCGDAGPIIVTANTGQFIRHNQVITASAGTATNSAIGDSLIMRYIASENLWFVTSRSGLWSLV